MVKQLELGIKEELEHRELIIKLLKEAGRPTDEDEIKKIAEEIAKVHIEEDPNYYPVEKNG